MYRRMACVVLVIACAAAVAMGEGPPLQYTIEHPDNVFVSSRRSEGRGSLFVTVQFRIRNAADGRIATDIGKDELIVEEDGQRVLSLDITAPAVELLDAVLALDVSGSMAAERKWTQAQQAARTFLDRLDARSNSGLILFDHQIRQREAPVRDRTHVRSLIDAAKPGGGTAYFDAAALGVEMLKDMQGRRAVVLLTDGVDMNSERTLDQVIKMADVAKVPIYTLGIGEPGKNEPVTTVLVLDRSGSMREKANKLDGMSKIDALKVAARRFVDLMRPNARTTLISFSTDVDAPAPFSSDKNALKRAIDKLRPQGGTSLYDAAYDGVETLVAARLPGRKALVVLTDGRDEDPGSRHSDDDVIEAAKAAGVALHMLGLGRPKEINEPVMQRMGKETGGSYHHAGNTAQLIEIFEQLSIDLHDDGIDEDSLRKLAEKSGGRYVPARDISKLSELFGSLADELQSTYTLTFPSRRPSHDGTARGIEIRVVRGGQQVSDVATVGYQVRGVVVPEMDAVVYVALLGGLGALLAAPAGMRKLQRGSRSRTNSEG